MPEDISSDDYLKRRPRSAWEEFGSEGDGEREARLARERSGGRARKSTAQQHAEKYQQQTRDAGRARHAALDAERERIATERERRERYAGISTADVMAGVILGQGQVRRGGQSAATRQDDYDPLAHFRAGRKERDRARKQRLRQQLTDGNI